MTKLTESRPNAGLRERLWWILTSYMDQGGRVTNWQAMVADLRDEPVHPDQPCGPFGIQQLPWAPEWRSLLPGMRCRARHPESGRCDLRTGHLCDHAVDRGMDTPRWSTRWTNPPLVSSLGGAAGGSDPDRSGSGSPREGK